MLDNATYGPPKVPFVAGAVYFEEVGKEVGFIACRNRNPPIKKKQKRFPSRNLITTAPKVDVDFSPQAPQI